MTGQDVPAAYIRRACQESLRRLGTDRIDLYQLHLGGLPIARAHEVAGTLEDLAGDVRGPGGPSWMGYFTDRRPAPEQLVRSAPSGRCSQAAGGRWPRVRWAGCLPAAHAPCRSRGSGTAAQAEQNAATLRLGPLPATAMAEIARLLGG